MAKKKNAPPAVTPKSKQTKFVSYFIVFALGFLVGIAFTVYKSSPPAQTQTTSEDDHDHGPSEETQQAILNLEAEVTSNPKNFQSWVQLGNLYYDTDQYQKAISAYTKSLEYHSGDANLLTDLGVMYRRTKQPEKAISYFEQAIKKDPSHLPSRLNKGIVLFYDLNDSTRAFATWDALIKINPDARAGNGDLIKDFVEQLKSEAKSN